MNDFNIQLPSSHLDQAIKHKIDLKTKPIGALGVLEELALKICRVQNTLTPHLNHPTFFICAGDHGIVSEGVSPYPQEVTYQMVLNFLSGGAAINVFARQHNFALHVVDCGVNHQFTNVPALIDMKVAFGTKNFAIEPAMSREECLKAMENGAQLVEGAYQNGSNIVGFGEMGIGNTTSAAALMCKISKMSPSEVSGAGTGLSSDGIAHKAHVIEKALTLHKKVDEPIDVLSALGGFEIATMVGGILKAAQLKMLILVDGFIATSALIVAQAINVKVLGYAIASHQSGEKGHRLMLGFLGLKPLLNLDMRLGEGTGAAVAYPLVESAVRFINEMNSFEGAGVSQSN